MKIGDMRILYREQPEYPLGDMLSRVEDHVELEVTIDERGVPASVKVTKSQVASMAKESLRAIKRWRFDPVVDHGVPVKATFRMDVEFIITNK